MRNQRFIFSLSTLILVKLNSKILSYEKNNTKSKSQLERVSDIKLAEKSDSSHCPYIIYVILVIIFIHDRQGYVKDPVRVRLASLNHGSFSR